MSNPIGPYPECDNKCDKGGTIGWNRVKTKRVSGDTVDFYQCIRCGRPMTWGYAWLEEALWYPGTQSLRQRP